MLGKQAEVKKVKEDLLNKIQTTKEKVKNNPTALLIGAFEDDFTVWVKDSFVGSLFTGIGIQYAYDGNKFGRGNGCGKSTILKSLARLLMPSGGHVYLDGKAIQTLSTKEVAKQLAILPQSPVAPEGLTVEGLARRICRSSAAVR